MPLYDVSLIAKDIQVHAACEGQAARFARSDARTLRRQWNFQSSEASLSNPGAKATENSSMAGVNVTLILGPPDDHDELWTFNATFTLTVLADTEQAAIEQALKLIRGS